MEEWRPVKDFSLYEVSSLGRVCRIVGVECRKPRFLHGYVNPANGYEQVVLCQNCKKSTRYVHRLVAEAFIGIPAGMTVNHKNGDKTHNWLENLEVVTLSENMKHAFRVLKRRPDRAKYIIRDPITGRIVGQLHKTAT